MQSCTKAVEQRPRAFCHGVLDALVLSQQLLSIHTCCNILRYLHTMPLPTCGSCVICITDVLQNITHKISYDGTRFIVLYHATMLCNRTDVDHHSSITQHTQWPKRGWEGGVAI